MEFRPLRSFVEVVRKGGFSQAAKAVLTSQSAVSKAVKQLEAEVGVPLLDRMGHRSVLTPAGEVVYRRGVKLLADRADLLAELDEIRGLRRGVLRLGLLPACSSALFTPLLALYRQRFPEIEVRLVERDSAQLEDDLRTGDIDVAGTLLPTSADFDCVPLSREPLVAVLPVGHKLVAQAPLRLADLMDTPFIMLENGLALHRIVIEASRRAGFVPAIAARSSQIDFTMELVAAGLGVAFLPRIIAAQRQDSAVCQVPLAEPDLEWSMAVAWRRGAYLSDAASAWLDLVRERRDQT